MFCFLRFSFLSVVYLIVAYFFLYQSDWFAINNIMLDFCLLFYFGMSFVSVRFYLYFCFSKFLVFGRRIFSFGRYLCDHVLFIFVFPFSTDKC